MASKAGIRGQGRDRLIDAAAVCYGKGGRGAMTLSNVCSEASASVGTAYHHFPGGLRDLEDSLYLDTLAAYQAGLIAELQRHSSAAAGVKAIVLFHLDWMATNLSLAHYLLFFSASWLAPERLEELEAMNKDFAHAIGAWRKPHIESGHIRRLPGELYGPLILGPAQQYGSEIIARASAEDVSGAIRRVGPALANAAWLAVKGKES